MGSRDVLSWVVIRLDDVARTLVISFFAAMWLFNVALGLFMMLFPDELTRFAREWRERFYSHIHIRVEYGPDWLVRTVGLAMTVFGGLFAYHFCKRWGAWP